MRAVHIVGVVEERLGDVHGHVAVGQVAVRLDPDEVQPPLRDDAAQTVVRAQLHFQLFGRQARAVVADLTDVPLQPCERLLDMLGRFVVARADDVVLLDVLDVDAELALPLLEVSHGGVHPQRAAAARKNAVIRAKIAGSFTVPHRRVYLTPS